MYRSKNSDGIREEFTASKKRRKRKITSKDKRIVNKKIIHKKNVNETITHHRKMGRVYAGLNLHKNTIYVNLVTGLSGCPFYSTTVTAYLSHNQFTITSMDMNRYLNLLQ